jgi:hypothetical protein
MRRQKMALDYVTQKKRIVVAVVNSFYRFVYSSQCVYVYTWRRLLPLMVDLSQAQTTHPIPGTTLLSRLGTIFAVCSTETNERRRREGGGSRTTTTRIETVQWREDVSEQARTYHTE